MEYIRLDKLVDLKQGMAINSHSNHLISEEETDLPLLRIADMPTKSKVVFMKPETPERFIANYDDIIYTRTGQVGLVFREQYGVVHNNCFRVYPLNEKQLSRNYLYWCLKLPSTYKWANTIAAGAAQPDLPHSSFKKMKIPMFPLPTQEKIASILSAYDNLIQNYKKQIEALQTAASELYKEWFVRFRFPGYKNVDMKDSSIGKIPKTFEVKKQNEVIKDYIGGGWGEDEQSEQFSIEAAVVRGADFPEFTNGDITTCPVRYHKVSNYNSRIIEPEDIVLEVSGGTQEQPVGRTVIVSEERLKRFNNKLICASFCKLIKLNKSIISPLFYYYWMQFVYDTRIIDRYQLQSTGIINFKFEYFLRKGDVLLPPNDLMNSFEEKVKVIHSKIEKLAIGITKLTQQRDLLLPRLMSGKLEVE